ncbi:hypothetical protein JCM19992_15040 [Thermostilla marina]
MRPKRAGARNRGAGIAFRCARRLRAVRLVWMLGAVCGLLISLHDARPLWAESASEAVSGPADSVDELLEERRRRREAMREEELPAYELGKIRVFPDMENRELPTVRCSHIQRMLVLAQANKQDFQGTLRVEFHDADSKRPIPVWDDARVAVERPVRLAKGQIKQLALDVLTPPPQVQPNVLIHGELRDRRGRVVAASDTEAMLNPKLAADVIVLSRTPEKYAFLDRLPVFAAPWDIVALPGVLRACRYAGDRDVPLPDNLASWACTAYLIWDQADPDVLDEGQQATLLAWLHFGGQLVISGPDSMEWLRGSFLEPYLPCRPADDDWTTAFSPDRFQPLVEPLVDDPKNAVPLEASRPIYGIKLEPQAPGREVPETRGLFYERRIGRGRIVVSAFPLSHAALIEWPVYDLVWRGWLLRLPPRSWEYTDILIKYRYLNGEPGTYIGACWWVGRDRNGRSSITDAVAGEAVAAYASFLRDPQLVEADPLSTTIVPQLREKCRIRVPPKRFVIAMLIGYVGLTIPCVWIVFRLAGKPEWSWIVIAAAAVVWTIVVVRQSQIHIGFVRAKTDIDIVEIEPDCSTARVAGWTGIYSSLATTFDLSLADAGGTILPVSVPQSDATRPLLDLGRSQAVALGRNDGTVLEDFRLSSNSVALFRYESSTDLGGTIDLANDGTAWRLVNGTNVSFESLGLLRRESSGTVRFAVLPRLDPGDIQEVTWKDARSFDEAVADLTAAWRTLEVDDRELPCTDMLPKLLTAAGEVSPVSPTTVAIGYVEGLPEMVAASPQIAQKRRAAIAMMYLDYPYPKAPVKDRFWHSDWRERLAKMTADEARNESPSN